jgi:hypothetical protein
MNESEMDPEGGQPMAGEKGRIPWIVVVALLVIALGIAAVTLRHKVTVIDGTVLLLERWTGRVTLIHKDGSFTRMEKDNKGRTPGLRLSELFKTGIRMPAAGGKTGAKTVKGPGGKADGGPGAGRQPAKAAKKGPEDRQAAAKEAGTPKNSGADTAQKQAQKPAARVSPFGSGTTTSKDLAETGAKIYSSVKWQGEQAYFQMAIRPYTDEVKKLRREKKETICIDLVDGKGTTVLGLTIPVDDMKPVRDDKNKITTLEYAKNIPIGRTDFLSIQDWKIRQKV